MQRNLITSRICRCTNKWCSRCSDKLQRRYTNEWCSRRRVSANVDAPTSSAADDAMSAGVNVLQIYIYIYSNDQERSYNKYLMIGTLIQFLEFCGML